jgi:hypothetical protein
LALRHKILSKTASSTSALFVDDNGYPMDGYVYEKKWDKVKRYFLKSVEESSYGDYIFLKRRKWRTHIGRGIFTNLCLENGLAETARELASLRGDSFVDSAQAYIDECKIASVVLGSLNEISRRSNFD